MTEEQFTEKVKHICMGVIPFVLLIILAIERNPDNDIYWMIETGRYLFEHKRVPTTNPWIWDENVSIIIQQPLCALLNYAFYCIGGLKNMWIFAVMENLILLLSSYWVLSRLNENKKSKNLAFYYLVTGEFFLLFSEILTTRPYAFTTLNMVLLVGSLYAYEKDKKFTKELLCISLVTLFQANYQMASLIAIPCFISCFFVGRVTKSLYLKEKQNVKELLKYAFFYLEFALISLLNPYGLNGATYLFKSSDAINMLKSFISETASPSMLSTIGVVVFVSIGILVFLIKNKKADISLIYLGLGSLFATICALRNTWMLFVYFTFCFTRVYSCITTKKQEKETPNKEDADNQKAHAKTYGPFYRMIMMGATLAFVFLGIMQLQSVNTKGDELESLFCEVEQIPDNERIYTTFNTGGFVEFCGKKCYVDARPELYHPNITKGENILQEWFYAEYSTDVNLDEFIEEKQFSYFLVTNSTNIYTYLKYRGATLIWSNSNISLYKLN